MDKQEITERIVKCAAQEIYDIIKARGAKKSSLQGSDRRLYAHPSDHLPDDKQTLEEEVMKVIDRTSGYSRSVRDFIAAGISKASLKVMQQLAAEEDERIFAEKLKDPFLVENAAKEGVQVLESGVQVQVLESTIGPRPAENAVCNVTYDLHVSTDLETSVDGGTIDVGLFECVPGFGAAVRTMHKGETIRAVIPPKYGYGSRAIGDKIPPYSILVFDIKLNDFTDPTDSKE